MAERTVLLVDDNEDAREAVAYLLKTMGGVDRAVWVDDGLAALRELRAGLRPCLIVLDLYTPGMGGQEFRAEQAGGPGPARDSGGAVLQTYRRSWPSWPSAA